MINLFDVCRQILKFGLYTQFEYGSRSVPNHSGGQGRKDIKVKNNLQNVKYKNRIQRKIKNMPSLLKKANCKQKDFLCPALFPSRKKARQKKTPRRLVNENLLTRLLDATYSGAPPRGMYPKKRTK